MTIPNLHVGLCSQQLIQWLCRIKGGTRLARFLAKQLNTYVFKGRWTAIGKFHVKYSLDIKSELEWQLLAYGIFDQPLLECIKHYLCADSVFIDIGANVGCICLPIAKLLGPRGLALSFEADPLIFAKLRDNSSLNILDNHRSLNIALGSAPSTLTFYRSAHGDSFGQAVGSLYPSTWHTNGSTFDATVDTLDRILREEAINRLDIVKIDVEGAELDVLIGALQAINVFRPILFIEACKHTYTNAGWTPQDLFDLLSPYNYDFEALDERNPGFTRPLNGAQDSDYLTLVARPR